MGANKAKMGDSDFEVMEAREGEGLVVLWDGGFDWILESSSTLIVHWCWILVCHCEFEADDDVDEWERYTARNSNGTITSW